MVIWLIGLSGAGKTTLGTEIVRLARQTLKHVVLLDGDAIREAFGNDLGHTNEDRRKNAMRICQLGKFLDTQGIHVVVGILSIFRESREWNRQNLPEYYEVFIDTPMNILESIDYKGLYCRAKAGEITDVAGIDLHFPRPSNPDLVISNADGIEALLSHAPHLVEVIKESENRRPTS